MGEGRSRGAALLLALLALAVAVAGCGGDSGDDDSPAHVNEDSGSTHGLPLDERVGTPPPPVKETDLEKLGRQAGCYVFLDLPEEGDKELPPDAPAPKYETDPPTSGDHVEPPHQQADGAYLLMPRASDFVAALDHGRMEIQYAPDIPEESQLELKGLYDTMYGGTLMFPNDEMNYAVAATTWRNRLACTSWAGSDTLDAIRAFGKATWGKNGSKPITAFPFTGPTPKDPAEADAS
jgi:hypothetical protein